MLTVNILCVPHHYSELPLLSWAWSYQSFTVSHWNALPVMHTNLMERAAYSLSTNRLTPHLFILCSNADRTPTPIFQRKHLDVMLSTCTQLLWTSYPRPVLSGPRTFKTLDDLSHCDATQFQGVGNLLIALAIFM